MVRSTLRKYYVLSLLSNLSGVQIISAIYVTFLLKNGLTLLEANLVNSIYFMTLFVCEVPTGAFADIFGRKSSFVIACALTSVSLFVYGSSHSFTGFALAEVIVAVGTTFRSGAFQAWVVDSLKHHGFEGDFVPIFARANFINQMSGAIGAVTGSYLAARNPVLPWYLGGTMMAGVTLVAAVWMEEAYFVRKSFSWRDGLASMLDIAKKSIRYGTENTAVRFILLVSFIQIYAVQALNMYWQPYFKSWGLKEARFGIIFTMIMGSLAAGSALAALYRGSGKERRIILLSQAVAGALALATAAAHGLPLVIGFFLLHEIGRGFWGPTKDGYLQSRIPSHERATISSFCNMAPYIGGSLGLIVSGTIAQFFGIAASWHVAGLILVIGAYLLREKRVPT